MTKKRNGSVEAEAFLEKLTGGPLTFGRMLRAHRLGEEETQTTFAERLRISKQQLSDIENDRRGVSVERAAEWAKALEHSMALFVELAIQGQLRAANLPFVVSVEPIGPPKRRRAA
jgi:transcriptional regulator with XRE-family HTH domain